MNLQNVKECWEDGLVERHIRKLLYKIKGFTWVLKRHPNQRRKATQTNRAYEKGGPVDIFYLPMLQIASETTRSSKRKKQPIEMLDLNPKRRKA